MFKVTELISGRERLEPRHSSCRPHPGNSPTTPHGVCFPCQAPHGGALVISLGSYLQTQGVCPKHLFFALLPEAGTITRREVAPWLEF